MYPAAVMLIARSWVGFDQDHAAAGCCFTGRLDDMGDDGVTMEGWTAALFLAVVFAAGACVGHFFF